MSKIINIGYKISKVWLGFCLIIIFSQSIRMFQDTSISLFELIGTIFGMSIIATTPFTILRYIKSQKQKELRNALH